MGQLYDNFLPIFFLLIIWFLFLLTLFKNNCSSFSFWSVDMNTEYWTIYQEHHTRNICTKINSYILWVYTLFFQWVVNCLSSKINLFIYCFICPFRKAGCNLREKFNAKYKDLSPFPAIFSSMNCSWYFFSVIAAT